VCSEQGLDILGVPSSGYTDSELKQCLCNLLIIGSLLQH
jgi:hypothetical protein